MAYTVLSSSCCLARTWNSSWEFSEPGRCCGEIFCKALDGETSCWPEEPHAAHRRKCLPGSPLRPGRGFAFRISGYFLRGRIFESSVPHIQSLFRLRLWFPPRYGGVTHCCYGWFAAMGVIHRCSSKLSRCIASFAGAVIPKRSLGYANVSKEIRRGFPYNNKARYPRLVQGITRPRSGWAPGCQIAAFLWPKL